MGEDANTTFIQRVAVYSKVAVAGDIGATVTVTQAAGGRMGLAIGVAYSSTGTLAVEASAGGVLNNTSGNPGNHPTPSVTSLGAGRLVYATSSCVYSSENNELCDYQPGTGWTAVTAIGVANNRLAVAYRTAGAETVSGHVFAHFTSLHTGAEMALVLKAA